MTDAQGYALQEALGNLSAEMPLRTGAEKLLNALGYNSQRTVDVGSVEDFQERYVPSELTERQRKLFESWDVVEIVFQFTATEITKQSGLFETPSFDTGRMDSFLFLTVDMVKKEAYTRTHLADTTRIINRIFKMPVILLFRHGSTLTLAAIHHRAHKRDDSQDVLKRVTLVKDIRTQTPHRAHIEILSDLSFDRMLESGVTSFEELHTKWEKTLDIEVLNKRFYREIFAWFERAVESCNFPDDGAGEGGAERHIIRLITRLLFIWFLKEKHLIPEELFEENFARSMLNNYARDNTNYYRAILQNLFFATLNTEIGHRSFNTEKDSGLNSFNPYRYLNLLTDPDILIKQFATIPFVNGGLFDCLDDFTPTGGSGRLIDAFTDNPDQGEDLCVPASIFFGPEDGLFAIFRRYKFTIEESTPIDHEVALDPELLGRVFENLLAAYNPETRETARRNTGSYYTPRPVVDYMVREVLTETLAANSIPIDKDLSWWRERLQYLLDHSNARNDANEFFEEADRQAVVAAIAEVRTLDPAVGSGAFPMGILQTLTLALRRLDPDNTLWEEIQKKRAKAKAGEAFDTHNRLSRDKELQEISATFEKYRQSDFGRKLYLIQNGIYGVDIQPIACQIAKLRFFISLVIEQKPDPSAPNLGIKPLPNLETRLVAADSLLGLKDRTNSLFQHEAIVSKQRQVLAVRERYFLADSRPRKLRCVETEQRLRSELQDILKTESQSWIAAQEQNIEETAKKLPNANAQEAYRDNKLRKLSIQKRKFDEIFSDANMIARWDPYNQNDHADWFDAEYMFGVSDGFDIVIGNPPYIQLQKNSGHAGNLYKGAGYKTFQKTGDIYQLFYERGCELLKPDTGILTYITSNSWLKAEYGRRLRKYFDNYHTPLTLIEMGKDVFDNAIVDTAVLIVRNGKDQPVTCRAVDVERASDGRFPPPEGDWGTLQPEGELPWMALSSVERSIMEKMEAVGTPLKQWDISIYYGIKTGYNKAFIVDTSVRDHLISEDPASEEILKPILRGRDIARYHANWAGLWLISTFPSLSLDIDAYPAIKRHLSSFGKGRLAQEGRKLPGGGRSRKKTSNAWYELQDTCAYHEEFRKPKLFWMHMSPEGRFALGEPNITCNQKCFMVTGKNLHYLCAILNSTLVTWFVSRIAVTTGMGLPQWDKFTVERVPVVRPDRSITNGFRDLVKSQLAAIDADDTQEITRIQKTIDSCVYELYNLTPEESKSVSRQVNG